MRSEADSEAPLLLLREYPPISPSENAGCRCPRSRLGPKGCRARSRESRHLQRHRLTAADSHQSAGCASNQAGSCLASRRASNRQPRLPALCVLGRAPRRDLPDRHRHRWHREQDCQQRRGWLWRDEWAASCVSGDPRAQNPHRPSQHGIRTKHAKECQIPQRLAAAPLRAGDVLEDPLPRLLAQVPQVSGLEQVRVGAARSPGKLDPNRHPNIFIVAGSAEGWGVLRRQPKLRPDNIRYFNT